MRALFALPLIALSFASCASPRPEAQVVNPKCVQFSEPFLMAAQVREGRSLEDALSMLSGVQGQTSSEADQFVNKAMEAAIRLVYAHPDFAPRELQRRVQLACAVDSNGKIRFNGL
ncbi:MAG: hypothetical protein WBP11_14345 [Dokdonella sp.]